jgi:ATP-dependent RNA helicase DDX5/DBP2
VKERSEEAVSTFKKTKQLTVFGNDVSHPIQSFLEAQFPKYIMDVLLACPYKEPTAIQSQGMQEGERPE